MDTRHLTAVCLFVCGAVTLGTSCDRFDSSKRAVLAKNAGWTVTAVGDLDAIGPAWGINVVRFELTSLGSPFATGELFQAGPHDLSFRDHYRDVAEWVVPNAVRIRYRSDGSLDTLRLTVKNEAHADVRWLRIRLTDILLVFALSAGASVELPTPHGMYPDISVRGEFLGGKAIERTAIVPDAASEIYLTLRHDTVKVDFKAADHLRK
jgi:hypothetical protein